MSEYKLLKGCCTFLFNVYEFKFAIINNIFQAKFYGEETYFRRIVIALNTWAQPPAFGFLKTRFFDFIKRVLHP
jgi:hypothetical protein